MGVQHVKWASACFEASHAWPSWVRWECLGNLDRGLHARGTLCHYLAAFTHLVHGGSISSDAAAKVLLLKKNECEGMGLGRNLEFKSPKP